MASEHHLEVYKGRAGCFRLVTLALGFELRQSCSAVARHSNTSFLRHDLVSQRRSRFMFFIVSWRSFQSSHHHLTARLFQVFQFVRVATRYLHLWTALGSSWAHWMFGCCVPDCFRACLQVMRKHCFCVMAHQRRDVEQHIKSCGSRRVAKRDSDGWLVVSVGLFSEMWNIDMFAGQRGDSFRVASFGQCVYHPCASVSCACQSFFRSVRRSESVLCQS